MQKRHVIVLPLKTQFVSTGEIPAWIGAALHPNDAGLRNKAEESHLAKLRHAIKCLELQQIDPITNIPTARYLKQGKVTVSDLTQYVAPFHIRVETSLQDLEDELRKYYPNFDLFPGTGTGAAQSVPVKAGKSIDKFSIEGSGHQTEELAELFDSVPVSTLETMFPAGAKWKGWAEHAKNNGLIDSRFERGLFNPYLSALWFLKKGIKGWDIARCNRTLAKNLPHRSIDSKHLLTDELPE